MVDKLERQAIVSALLSWLNDSIAVTPYAHGFLVSLPLYFYDDDRVKLFVEPFEGGVRVGDRGLTAMRLHMSEVSLTSKRVQEALRQSTGSGLFAVGESHGEITGFGSFSDLPKLVYGVASTVIRVDQVRWLATERRPPVFRDRVVSELRLIVGQSKRVTPNAAIRLQSGREKHVTASVVSGAVEKQTPESSLYVQALSGQDSEARESSVSRCYHLFSLAATPRDNLVAVASGSRSDWPDSLVDEISRVSTVAFFEESGSIAHVVGEKLATVG